MKSRFTRSLSLLLLLALTVTVLVSCADGPGGTPSDSDTAPAQQTEEETRVTHDLPPMTFDGYTFGMLHWFIEGWGVSGIDLYAEDTTGDPIGDEVYKRNSRLESSLDISFEYDERPHSEVVETIRQSFRSGDDFYDIYYARLTDCFGILLEGAFLDYITELPYIDLSKPYWDQSVQKDLSFGGHLFFCATDLNITDKNATDSYLFNKDLARDYNLPNFYDLVRSGDWTFEALYDNMNSFDGDMDGDGTLDATVDIMGFIGQNDVMTSLFYGSGGHFVSKDEFDLPYDDFYTDDNISIVDGIFDIMYSRTFFNGHQNIGVDPVVQFADGHGLFHWQRMHDVVRTRGVEGINFGILPTPKYDEWQENYMSMISEHLTGLPGVLYTETDPETVSYILEAMSAESHYGLQEAYYDITLKTKSARDDESQDMLDLIFAHRTLDLGELCQFGGFPEAFLTYPSANGDRNITSRYRSMESAIGVSIEKFIEMVDTMETERW